MNAVRVIQGQVSQNVRASAVVRNGSVVTARVVSQNGNGSYTVSLAGQMIEVRSKVPLQKGQVFQAKVAMSGNQLFLSLVSEAKNAGELVQKLPVQSQNLSPQISEFLSSLGFEPNLDSFKIFQFMQQLGMKIDVPLAKKALLASKKDGSGDEKAQVALLLEEKGIAASDERVSAVLGNGKRENENGKRQKREEREEKLGVRSEELGVADELAVISSDQRETRNLSTSSVSSPSFVRDFFDSVDSAALSHKVGILSAFNTVLSARGKNPPLNHWLLLPFEWNFQNYAGNIRLLFDSELKNIQKAVIDMKNSANQHKFLLGFEKNQLSAVKFATSISETRLNKDYRGKPDNDSRVKPDNDSRGKSDNDKINLEGLLSHLLLSNFNREISVEQLDFDSLCGFCADDEVFSQVQGEA